MGWIKNSDNELINLQNIICFKIDETLFARPNDSSLYEVVAETTGTSGYFISKDITKQEAEEILARIERWLASGAEGVFQI